MNKKGFTMVELLVVLLIVGILAAVATPLYLANSRRARASEAVATMSQIRQAQRDWNVSHPGQFYSIAAGSIDSQLPTSVSSTGAPTPSGSGVDVDCGVSQYFANQCFTVTVAATPAWDTNNTAPGNPGAPVDFLIRANGSVATNTVCTGGSDDCAVHSADVAAYQLEMDNSGRIFVSYDSGVNWTAW